METVTHYVEKCPLCGEDVKITHRYEDGTDWLGHHYGFPETRVIRHNHKCDKVQFKKMCLNCNSYKAESSSCTNAKAYAIYFGNKDKTNVSFDIKKPDRHCSCWSLSQDIINELFK